MLQDEQYIIDTLGIADWSADEREPVVIEATMRIGKALIGELNDQQYNEYKGIVDDDRAVIDAWLDQNVPDYKDNPTYKAIESAADEDPEQNNPAKLFATLAWLQVNVPDIQERIAKTLAAYKEELGQ